RGEVNAEMYVHRPDLESGLVRAIHAGQHIAITGESGCGKSWLYKSVFQENNVFYKTVNLALATDDGDISSAIVRTVLEGKAVLKETEKRSGMAAMLQIFGLSRETARRYGQVHEEPFLACARAMRAQAKKRSAFVVFENLEQVASDPKILKQLARLAMLLDDEKYSAEDVRLCFVGTSSDMMDLLSGSGNLPVRQRIFEMPEVSRLSEDEADTLVMRGFVGYLGYGKPDVETVVDEIVWDADRIPQHIQALCFYFADALARNEHKFDGDLLAEARISWLQSQQNGAYATIAKNMTLSRDAVGRKNQLLYTLGQLEKIDFSHKEVEAAFRAEFPNTTLEKGLNVAGMMAEFTRDPAIIRKSPVASTLYRFSSPIYRIAIRAMLVKDESERVTALSPEDFARGATAAAQESASKPPKKAATQSVTRRRYAPSTGVSKRQARRAHGRSGGSASRA
nr:AAA family ATPase [Polyangiaceae bacterium]